MKKLLRITAVVLSCVFGYQLATGQPVPFPDAVLAEPQPSADPVTEPAATFDAAPTGDAVPAASPLELDPGVPSPTDDAGGFTQTLYDWWKAGRLKPAIILALWGLALLLAAKIDWLQVGRRAVVMAGVVEALTDLVARAGAGVSITWGLIFSAITTFVLAILAPKSDPSKKKPAGARG